MINHTELYIFKKDFLKKKKNYDPFLWMGFNSLKATEPLQGDRLFFTIQFPRAPGTQLINLGKMKGCR